MDQFRTTPKEAHVDEIHDLVAHGKEKGWLTTDEIADALGGLDLSAEHVDYVYTLLADEEIEVLDDEPGADSSKEDLSDGQLANTLKDRSRRGTCNSGVIRILFSAGLTGANRAGAARCRWRA